MRLCQWYLKCDNPAVNMIMHPVIGWVDTCERCTEKAHVLSEGKAEVVPISPE